MLSEFDKARIDGYSGTAAEFVLDAYKAKGLSAARELGFNGYESELIALVDKQAEREKAVADKLALRGDSAYQLAVQKGFEGDEIAWLNSLKGSDGLSAYEIALTKGFEGDLSTWVASLQGSDGSSAYELALQNGFDGTEKQWLESLKALDGLSAYELAQSLGFTGTLEEFIASLKGEKGDKGDAGRDGRDGQKGDKGDKGDMPAHQWDGTRLRFERPDGTWGEWVELKGAMVAAAGIGASALSIQKFYDGTANFPVVGKTQVLYFDTSSTPYSVYIWDGAAYQSVGGGSGGTAYTVAVQGKNTSGALIPKGTVLMATGTVGASGIITVAPMDGTNPANYKYLIGVAGADIAVGATGDVVDLGKVRGIDTTVWAEGDVLWVSTTTAGQLTNVEPTNGLNMPVAFVVTDHHVNGEIMVRVTPIDENHFVSQTFETVSKNLKASDATFNYNGSGDLTSIVYANGITKTLGYNSGGDLITVTLSGATPSGIDLVKTLGYTSGGDLSSLTYSLS